MKMIALLLIQGISCLLAGWRVSETIFLVFASTMWLLVFKYVFIKVGAKTKRPVTEVTNLYLVLAGVCCIVSPIACLISIVLYPLWIMNKALKFASVKFSNDNESAFENGFSRNYVGRRQSLTALPYKEMLSEREFMSHQLEHCSDGSANLDQPNSTCSSAMGPYGNEISISTHDINPASGLPMIENVDVAGNVYGIDRNH
ncbi:hypothetical protein ACR3SC_004279 [Klebsiella variicola]|uniref:hypothetical protein n=1 Tax=Klebsiella variicola TaxID=244366 RepID=UPI0020748B59|nr:hypothetical protein [Klebsiella pneumoniae]